MSAPINISQRELRLRDGAPLDVRPLEPDDRQLVADFFDGLSERARFDRFGGAKPRLSEREIAFLSAVDHRDHEAFVALEPVSGEPVGLARWVRDANDDRIAEVAVTVADRWQSRGVGTALSRRLVRSAREGGIERLRASVLASNERALSILRRLGRLVEHEFLGTTLELVIAICRGASAGSRA
jgi:RimJ/RimL family protein N-acetyltransferase